MSAVYSLDTSAILGMFIRRFPPDVVPSFWTKMDALVESGAAVCIDHVHGELKAQSDDPERWVRERSSMIRPTTQSILKRTLALMQSEYPVAFAGSSRSQVDPFVIALAMEEGLIVVSDEQSEPKSKIPKIPDLCKKLGVPHEDVFGLARREGWTF